MEEIFLKRIYEPFDENDGERILIDRLWPRGIRKEDVKLSMWAKEIAPTSGLRKWFSHKPELFAEFNELSQKSPSSRNEVSREGMNGFFILYIMNLKTKK